MARTRLDFQVPTRDGLTPQFTAATTDGHFFSNNGRTVLRFKNTGAEAVVTIRFGGSRDGIAIDGGREITVPATTGDVTTAVWPTDDYAQSDGTTWIDYPVDPTGLSVAALAL
jgi:hypothetical protein